MITRYLEDVDTACPSSSDGASASLGKYSLLELSFGSLTEGPIFMLRPQALQRGRAANSESY